MTSRLLPQDARAPAFSHAYVRKPGATFSTASHGVGIPDPARALYQHDAYCRALEACGVDVRTVRQDPQFPDSCFINDLAVVTPSLAVIANFGERHARQGEQHLAASLLAGSRILKFITSPGILDASDVARIGNHFIIGLSARTNHEGAAQLAYFLTEFGYDASVIDLGDGCQGQERLGTAVCDLGPVSEGRRILLREDLARHYAFIAYDKMTISWDLRAALDSLLVNATLLMPQGFGAVRDGISATGIRVQEVNVSEFLKVGFGLSSLSLRLPARAHQDSVINLSDIRQRRVA